jgi:hypothetical protein
MSYFQIIPNEINALIHTYLKYLDLIHLCETNKFMWNQYINLDSDFWYNLGGKNYKLGYLTQQSYLVKISNRCIEKVENPNITHEYNMELNLTHSELELFLDSYELYIRDYYYYYCKSNGFMKYDTKITIDGIIIPINTLLINNNNKTSTLWSRIANLFMRSINQEQVYIDIIRKFKNFYMCQTTPTYIRYQNSQNRQYWFKRVYPQCPSNSLILNENMISYPYIIDFKIIVKFLAYLLGQGYNIVQTEHREFFLSYDGNSIRKDGVIRAA